MLTVEEERFVASYRRRAVEPLPPVRADDWDWQRSARCRGMDPAVFFPRIDRGSALARSEAQAKAICRECPVLADCRRHALAVGERYGVWGGLTTTERALHGYSTRSASSTPPAARVRPDCSPPTATSPACAKTWDATTRSTR